MNQSDIDKHLDAVLRASGSGLRYFSMQKTLDAMRTAMLAAMTAASWTPVTAALPDADLTVLLALSDGEVWQGYLDGETWRGVDNMPITGARVTHWMHTPAHPVPEALAAPMRTAAPGCPERPAPAIQQWHTGLPLPGGPACTVCDDTGSSFGKACECRSPK